ncbi:hypothetical protein LOTGIDRAFT_56788, partial [Lottia gigantea]
GLAILFNNNFNFKLHNTFRIEHALFLDLSIEDFRLTLINLYGPNDDNPKSYDTLFETIELIGNQNFIICGDFNLVLNPDLDCKNYKHINNPKARENFLKWMEVYDIRDVFRDLYPSLIRYTWRKRNPQKHASLDYFLTSTGLVQFLSKHKFENSYRSDHSGIVLQLKFKKFLKGNGIWKFNNSLLSD